LILLESGERPLIGSEEIGGHTFTTRTHDLAVFAFRPGTHVIRPFAVRFSVAGKVGTKERTSHRLETPELRFESKLPPGAENLSMLICTSKLAVAETWAPKPGRVRVGDAIVRKITLTATDVPAMALPPVPFPKIDGLGVYRRPPAVEDLTERGDFIGKRVDAVTYVCQRTGTIRLPALVIPWWNLEAEKLERVRLPAVAFEVQPGPAKAANDAPAAAVETTSGPSPWWLALAAVLIGAGLVLWTQRRKLQALIQGRRAHDADSESGTFAALITACRSNEPGPTMNALYRWLDAALPGQTAATVAALATRASDPDLDRELRALDRAVLDAPATWSGAPLAAALHRARASLLGPSPGERTRATLPALNPSRHRTGS
jgi:hypothetical protein